GFLRPPLARALQVRAQVAVTGVLESQGIEDALVLTHEREGVVDPDRARMPVEQLAEVGLAQPAIDVRADLDADGLRHGLRVSEAPGEIDLTKAARSEPALDRVAQARFGAGDDLAPLEDALRRAGTRARSAQAARRGGGGVLHDVRLCAGE